MEMVERLLECAMYKNFKNFEIKGKVEATTYL
jgi:hypothetical protein